MPSEALISAPSSNVVWTLVGGQVLYRSVDRGDSWEQRGLPPSGEPFQISFVSDREGWVATIERTGGECPANYQIWRTLDAGANFHEVDPKGLTGNACTGALTVVDPTTGYLSGGGNETDPFVYRTTDGGSTWTAATAPRAAGAPVSALSLSAVKAFGTSLLLPVIDFSKTPARRDVYRSTDGGATWSFLATVPTGQVPAAVGLATATRWFVLGDGPASAQETTDAGATWHGYATDYQQAAPIGPALYFAEANVGYATVRGSIQRTIDGGAHWTQLRTPGT